MRTTSRPSFVERVLTIVLTAVIILAFVWWYGGRVSRIKLKGVEISFSDANLLHFASFQAESTAASLSWKAKLSLITIADGDNCYGPPLTLEYEHSLYGELIRDGLVILANDSTTVAAQCKNSTIESPFGVVTRTAAGDKTRDYLVTLFEVVTQSPTK